jgi:hypothetical protein
MEYDEYGQPISNPPYMPGSNLTLGAQPGVTPQVPLVTPQPQPVAPVANIPTYGYELRRLMQRYGVTSPTPPRTSDQAELDRYFKPINETPMYKTPKGNALYNTLTDITTGKIPAPEKPLDTFFPGTAVCKAGERYDPVTNACVPVSTTPVNVGGNQCPPGFIYDEKSKSCVPTAETNMPGPVNLNLTAEQIRNMTGTVEGNANLFNLYKQGKVTQGQAESALGADRVAHWLQQNTFGGQTVNDRSINALAQTGAGADVLRSLETNKGATMGDVRRVLGDEKVGAWAQKYDPALYQKYFGGTTMRDMMMRNPDGSPQSLPPAGKAKGGMYHSRPVNKYAEGDLRRPPPQSMMDFAQQNSSPSLDGLVRQYAGAPVAPAPVDPVAAARERYEAASQRLRAAAMAGMQETPKGPSESEKYFRLASAFLDPGKTGSFGEAAGRAAAAMGDYNREKRAAENDSLAERRNFASQLAELDMDAAGTNLDTELTMQARRDAANSPQGAFGKQAMDEGHAFGTPSYYARVKELQELDMAYKERALISLEDSRRSLINSRDNAPTLTDDALDIAVDQYLAGDTTAATGYSRSPAMKVQFTNRLAERALERGMGGADIAAATAAFQGDKAGFRTVGTRAANADLAVTEALKMMPLALEASSGVDRTQYPTLNEALLAFELGTGDEDVVRLGIAVNSLVNIYTRAVSPTGTPTVSDKEHARELLDAAWSSGQFATAIDQLAREMMAAKASPGQVREDMLNTVTGKLSKENQEAMDWATANPDDPRSAQIMERINGL